MQRSRRSTPYPLTQGLFKVGEARVGTGDTPGVV